MTSNQQRAIIVITLAGSFLNQYDRVLSKQASELFRRVKKAIVKLHRINPAEYEHIIKGFDGVYRQVLGEEKGAIEIMSIVSYALGKELDYLRKFNITEKLLNSYHSVQNDTVDLDIELKSKKLVNDMLELSYEKLGIEYRKVNLSTMRKTAEFNAVLSGAK